MKDFIIIILGLAVFFLGKDYLEHHGYSLTSTEDTETPITETTTPIEEDVDKTYSDTHTEPPFDLDEMATTKPKYEKENDFMLAVLFNPNATIYTLLTSGGLTSSNTQFLSENEYYTSQLIQDQCDKMFGDHSYETVHKVYERTSVAWEIFKEVEDTDLSMDGMGKYFYEYDLFDTSKPTQCPYPELKHKLSIVPLRLSNN